jgi:hypothetical protein
MANLLLTQRCVRACPYCFAKKHMGESSPDDLLSWEDLIYVADFFEGSGERHISLLGGEPTLHPQFVDYVLYLIERGMHVNVFTNGIMSERRLSDAQRSLCHLSPEQLSVVCNLNHPSLSSAVEIERIDAFLGAFGRHTSAGYNIYQSAFDLSFLFDAINRFGLKRHVRLGLAHPIPGEANTCVTIAGMPTMAACLLSHVPLFQSMRVAPGFDCGFPLCVFTDEQLGILFKLNNGRLSFGCGPAFDIGQDLSVWSCFPLSHFHKKSLYDFNTLAEVGEFYKGLHAKVRVEAGGLYQRCDSCRHRETELCMGGCLAHVLSWLHDEEPVRFQEVYV